MVLREAFRRLGITLRVDGLTLVRRSAASDSGELDGDIGRAYTYGSGHPNVVRVEEPMFHLEFLLYTANPTLHIGSLTELKDKDVTVEFRRGSIVCEKKLKELQLKRVSDIANIRLAFKKLIAGRMDLYCEAEILTKQLMMSPEFKDNKSVRIVASLGTVAIHPYLHHRHAELALRLAEVIRKMKKEGLIKAYQEKLDASLGLQ
jgi:hypothetical protein